MTGTDPAATPQAVVHLPRSLVALFPALPRRVELAPDASAHDETVDAVLRALDDLAPGLRDRLVEPGPRLRPHINVYVAGSRGTLATPVPPGAEVHVIPAVSGGADHEAGDDDAARSGGAPLDFQAERAAWLAERRAATRAAYDATAAEYEAQPYPIDEQRRWVARLVALVPPGGVVLDAPCGTGLHFATVVGAGRRVVGIDQSTGMLAEARAKGLAERLDLVGLQELDLAEVADAVMTVDAMENVPPEDWPAVLGNLRRALRPGGYLYLTVEEIPEPAVAAAFAALVARGAPAVSGEVVEGDVAGYHFYPGRERVLGWFADAGLAVLDEGVSEHDGWSYRHFLLRAP